MRIAIFSLLFVLIISLASAELDKRNHCSSSYKRDVLSKRNYKKCPCATAESSFDGEGGFLAFFALAQNECGQVQVFGRIFQGVDPNQSYKFNIVDDCGNVIAPLGDLGVKPNGHGGTDPFSQSFDSFNLNCDDSGIKFTKSAVYRKRNCHPTSYHKRQAGSGGAYMQIAPSGNAPTSSPISGY